MRLFYRTLVCFILISIAFTGLSPAETLDDSPEVTSLYARGKRLLREGQYLEASRVFEELTGRFQSSKNLDLFIFNRAKADYYFGDYDEALAGFSNFAARFPGSPFAAHAHFFQGNINYIRGNLTRALKSYVKAYGMSGDTRFDRVIESSIMLAIQNAGSVSVAFSDFSGLPVSKKCSLSRKVADVLVSRQEFEMANSLVEPCGDQIDMTNVPADLSGELKIAVILPLTGELQAFSEEIYNGAIIAADFYRVETGKKITLDPFDTKGDPVNAARIVRELTNSPYDLILGPLTSEEAAVASAALACDNIPLIAPAATQAGLTLMNESSFQLSPNIELQGVEMAEYAIRNLGADSAAIITSTGTDDMKMAKAFTRKFEALGGTVVAEEFYRSRDRDFGDYIEDIKAMLLGAHPDSVYFIDERGDTLDSEAVPAHIDCLFMPGRPRQLKLLLPQVNYYNLQAEFLGSDDWGDAEVLKLGDANTRQGVFPSPFLQQSSSPEYVKFATAYDSRYGKQPQRLSSLGYDAVRLATKATAKGRSGRNQLIAELKLATSYPGAAGIVTFGDNRENVAMPLYRIEGGHAVYLGVGTVTGVSPAPEGN